MYWTSLLNEPDLFLCPSSVDDNDDGGELARKFTPLRPIDTSYAGRNGVRGVIVDKMPTSTAMMSDDNDNPENHDDGINIVFFDTHVEWSQAVRCSDLASEKPIDQLQN